MNTLQKICFTLLVLGGLNWGLVGLFELDLVAAIFGGQTSALSRIVYILVGASAVYVALINFRGPGRLTRTRDTEFPRRAA